MTSGGHENPILQRVAAGDPAATRECVDRFGGLVWSIARRLLIPDSRIEDAVQDVFVELWKSAGKYDSSIASETAFVAIIARRRLIDQLRKLERQISAAPLPPSEDPGVLADVRAGGWRGADGTTIDHGIRAEEVVEAARALDQLTPEQQRVLRLSIHRGLSHEAIARVLDIPLGTVKTHARRGLIRLRQLLAAPGASDPTGAPAVASPKGGGA